MQNELQTKKRFVRYISHEIRTPLNTVTMGLQVLREELLSDGASQSKITTLKSIEDACDIAIDILNDLLLFDKIESGVMKLDITKVPVRLFISETVRPFFLQV